ncbi:hypothetical protein [Mucilaginibacter kameinonensis]|uniref:hypothetical protein n=1 Tax=Mucilaginibacter kameinonensis TaxID=452286 RepID=UPI000EF7E3D1|nr:hypothetical protein [Mucilaginibacter kameinonensis]
MLNDNGDRFDAKLVDLINTRFGKHKAKIPVLKWCLMHALKTGQRTGFQYLSGADLNLNEKSDLILFLGDLLEKVSVSMKKEESFWQFFNEDAGDRLFDFFFGLELINEDYKTTLNTLLKFELNSYKKIIVYTTLGIIAVINLNMKELEKQIIRLKNMESYNSAGFSFNPLNCLELIFNYLKHGTIRSDLMRGLAKNAFLLQVPTQHGNAASDLVFLLGIYTFCGFLPGIRSKGLLRKLSLLSSADKVQNTLSVFDFFKRMITADIHFRNGEHAAVSAIFTKVHTSYGLQHDLLTPYMETLLLSLKIKMMLTSGTSDLIPFEIKGIHAVTEVSGSKLTKLYLDSLLIRHEQLMSRHPDLKRELAYDIMKVISKQELNQNLIFFEQDLSRWQVLNTTGINSITWVSAKTSSRF